MRPTTKRGERLEKSEVADIPGYPTQKVPDEQAVVILVQAGSDRENVPAIVVAAFNHPSGHIDRVVVNDTMGDKRSGKPNPKGAGNRHLLCRGPGKDEKGEENGEEGRKQ